MTEVLESDTERNGFLSYPTEVHALGAGFAVGLVSGLAYGYEYTELALTLSAGTIGAATGIHGVGKIENRKLSAQVNREPHYTLGGLAAGIMLGIAVKYTIDFL